jgi:hypothetical protein
MRIRDATAEDWPAIWGFIGRSLPSFRLWAVDSVKTPSQTVHADFPHTAYG